MKPLDDLKHEHIAIRLMLNIMAKIAEEIKTDRSFDVEAVRKIIDFLRTFADKCHHGKEEDSLFPALVAAGMPDASGPIPVMLHEHAMGRGFINGFAEALSIFNFGDKTAAVRIVENMEHYISLMRNHILKEEEVLFPMAEKLLNEPDQQEVTLSFERIENEVAGHGVHERYHQLLDQLRTTYLG